MARSIEYRVLEEEDLEDIWNIILELYPASDGTVAIFNFSADDLRKLLRKSVKDSISQRVSIGAFDTQKEKLIGIILGNLGRLHQLTNKSDEQLQRLEQHEAVTQYFFGNDPSDILGTREYLRIILMVSNPAYNEDGVEHELCKRCEEIASMERCKKIVSVVSSARLREILREFEYVSEKTLSIRHYQDPITGERIFADIPREPDTDIALEVKYLHN